jgi:hypothetical protein
MLGHDLPEGVLDAICEQSGDYSRERRDRAEQDVFQFTLKDANDYARFTGRQQYLFKGGVGTLRKHGRALCVKQSS